MSKVVSAPHGEKTIRVTIAFWTDGLAGKGKVRRGHAWNTGAIYMVRNKTHGIVGKNYCSIPFGDRAGLKEIPGVIREVLKRNKVVLHRSRT